MLAHNSASLQTAFQHELHFYVLGLQNTPGGNLRALSKVQLRGEILRIKKNHLAKKRETDSSVSNTFLSGKKKKFFITSLLTLKSFKTLVLAERHTATFLRRRTDSKTWLTEGDAIPVVKPLPYSNSRSQALKSWETCTSACRTMFPHAKIPGNAIFTGYWGQRHLV